MKALDQNQSKMVDSLQEEINNHEAIYSIMEAFDIDEKQAGELWKRFRETVRKMKEVISKSEGG